METSTAAQPAPTDSKADAIGAPRSISVYGTIPTTTSETPM
jgi:hypothetical protein